MVEALAGRSFVGSIKSYNEAKGWGHIDCPETRAIFGRDMFVLRSSVEGLSIAPGDQVQFSVAQGRSGPEARSVTLIARGSTAEQQQVQQLHQLQQLQLHPQLPQLAPLPQLPTLPQLQQLPAELSSATPNHGDLCQILAGHRFVGTIKAYNEEKGWGHILCPQTHEMFGRDMFVLRTCLGGLSPSPGDAVTFTVQQGRNGPEAREVLPLTDAPSATSALGAYVAHAPAGSPGTYLGSMKAISSDKGWAHIACEETRALHGKDVFVPRSVVFEKHLQEGDVVQFTTQMLEKGPAVEKLEKVASTSADAPALALLNQGDVAVQQLQMLQQQSQHLQAVPQVQAEGQTVHLQQALQPELQQPHQQQVQVLPALQPDLQQQQLHQLHQQQLQQQAAVQHMQQLQQQHLQQQQQQQLQPQMQQMQPQSPSVDPAESGRSALLASTMPGSELAFLSNTAPASAAVATTSTWSMPALTDPALYTASAYGFLYGNTQGSAAAFSGTLPAAAPLLHGAPLLDAASMPQTVVSPSDAERVFRGSIKSYSAEKGWGHIDCTETRALYGKDMFVLRSELKGASVNPGDEVEFQVTMGTKGIQAKEVRIVSQGGGAYATVPGVQVGFRASPY